jgi:hypothetical protein
MANHRLCHRWQHFLGEVKIIGKQIQIQFYKSSEEHFLIGDRRFKTVLNFSQIMAEDKSKDAGIQEFKLEPDTELRFEVEVPETKNDKVVLEVCISTLRKIIIIHTFDSLLITVAQNWLCRDIWH